MNICDTFNDIMKTKGIQNRLSKIVKYFGTNELGATRIDMLFSRLKACLDEIERHGS